MKEPTATPTLAEFLAACDQACGFLVNEHGFERLDEPLEYNLYSVRFRKDELEVHVYGENYGKSASCDLVKGGGLLPLALIVPPEERAQRIPGHTGSGQLAQVHAIAARLRDHASDFLRGDFGRFDAALAEWKRMTRPRQITAADRQARERASAVTAAGHASRRGDHAEVVRLLEPYADALSKHQRRMLATARERLDAGR